MTLSQTVTPKSATEARIHTGISLRRFERVKSTGATTIIKVLKTASKSLFKEYCKSVTSRISDVTQLIAFTQLGDIIAYYEAELKTLDEMLDEYEEYLWSGNFFYSFLGGER